MEITTISVDRETKARLEKLAADKPMMRYLRELSINLHGMPESTVEKRLASIEAILRQRAEFENTPVTLAEMIVECRDMAKKLNYSQKRMKFLDTFMQKSKPGTVEFIYNDLKNKLNGKVETLEEVQGDIVRDLISRMSNDQRLDLMNELKRVMNGKQS